MKKSIIIGGVVIVVLIAIFSFSGTDNNGSDIDSISSTSGSEAAQKFAELVSSGKDVECTFESDQDGNVTTGQIYLADKGEKVRGDFELTQVDGTTMQGNIVRKDGWNYTWGSFSNQGVKVQVTEEDRDQLFASQEGDQDFVDNDVQFDCKTWSVDNSKFDLPGDIEFLDFSSNMMEINDASQMMGEEKCSVCDQVPDASAQEQCRLSLGC